MGIGSLLAKPISKAMAKPVAKQASRVVPEISQDVAESMATDAPIPAKPIATRARGVASPRIIREKEPALVQDVPEMETDTGLLRKIEETAPPISADPLFKKQVDRTEDFGVEPELIADSNADAFEALGLSAEKKEAWRKKNKTSQRSKLLPEIEEAAQKLFEGKLTSKEFRKLSEEKQPIVPLDEVPEMPSFEDIAGALTEAQVNKGIVGLNMKIPKGERVSSRLDIPAYNEYNTWVVSLHEGNKKSGAPIGYAKTTVLQNVEFVSDSKVALDIARRKPLGAGGRMGKATIARIFGDYVPHNPEAAKSYAEKIFNDPEWTQVGMNPYRASYFYDKSDNMPVVSADEVVQIGPLVMAKNVKKATPDDAVFKVNPKDEASPTFSKGGVVKNEYKTFAVGGLATPPQNILAEGGMLDDSGEMVNGTEVPAGSLAEEVADDVPAMLSEGEFVLPADVVRFIGLERLMKMRDKAKEGLERMEEVGQMGNAEEVGDPDQPFDQDDDAFESEIDSIMAEDDTAMQTEQLFAAGGYVSGSDVNRATRNPAVDVRYYKHSDGRVMYITFINDKPMTAIPQGFSQVSAEDARQVGRKAEEREKSKPVNDAADGGSGADGRDDNDNQANRDVRVGGVFGGGDGSKGYESGDVPGAGISIAGQDAAFKALNAAQYAKKAAIVNPLIGGALYLGGKGAEAYLDKQIDKMTAAYEAVAAPPALPGMGTFAARDGGISTISNQGLIDKSDMSMFGITSAQMDAERNARLADEARLAEQSRQEDQARAEAAARAQAQAQAEAAARADAQRAYDARIAAERQAEADRARAAERARAERARAEQQARERAAAEARAREVASNPGGWSDSQRAEAAETGMVSVNGVSVSNAATIAAQDAAMFGGDSNSGGGGGDFGGMSNQGEGGGGPGSGGWSKGGFVRPRKKSKKK